MTGLVMFVLGLLAGVVLAEVFDTLYDRRLRKLEGPAPRRCWAGRRVKSDDDDRPISSPP